MSPFTTFVGIVCVDPAISSSATYRSFLIQKCKLPDFDEEPLTPEKVSLT
jgi:hypothetical protein